MNDNTDSTSNSIKFTPMPMSALFENLMPLQNAVDNPNDFYSSDDSENSFVNTVAKKPSPATKMKKCIPSLKIKPNQLKSFSSEKKFHNEHNKENSIDHWVSNQTHPAKEPNIKNSHRNFVTSNMYSISETNKLISHDILTQNSTVKKTPELHKIHNSGQKLKTGTPTIKSGIRKFTPGSAKYSNKKMPQKTVIQNREKVRCELFTPNPPKIECQYPMPCPKVPSVPGPVPETPINRRAMSPSYAATPSYPQGVVNNNSNKVLFKKICIKKKTYMFIKILGTGGSSEVYKVLEVGTSSEYAIKCVYLTSDQELAQGYVNEVRLLRELQNSDRVIKLIDYEYDCGKQCLRIVMEAGETDLSSFLKARGTGLPPALVLHYWEEMLHAVLYIHEHGVIHADLKPANFLLVCGRLKLIDFGIASAVSGDATSVVRSQATGTYSYISPEALMGGAGGYSASAPDGAAPIKISYRSDVWSLGCILYSMVYGRTPFGHIPNLAKLAAILNPNHRIEYPPAEHLPPSLIAALKWCLTYNARARPTVRELLSIPYLQPARAPLPQPLLDKLQPLVTPQEYQLLQRAQL